MDSVFVTLARIRYPSIQLHFITYNVPSSTISKSTMISVRFTYLIIAKETVLKILSHGFLLIHTTTYSLQIFHMLNIIYNKSKYVLILFISISFIKYKPAAAA